MWSVQTFVYNSILPIGLEFNCMVRHFLCPWHWLLIDFNIIRDCIRKFVLYYVFLSGMLWSGCFVTWVGYVTQWKVTPYTWLQSISCKTWYFTYYRCVFFLILYRFTRFQNLTMTLNIQHVVVHSSFIFDMTEIRHLATSVSKNTRYQFQE